MPTLTEKATIKTLTTHYIDGAFVESHEKTPPHECSVLRPFYGSVPFSSKMTNVQLGKKVCQFSRISTARCHFAREAHCRRLSA